MFKTKIVMLFFVAAVVYAGSVAWAADNALQEFTFSVQAINEISISNQVSIRGIKNVYVGSREVRVFSAVSAYSVTTNEINKKITGVLNTALPGDTSLKISLEAPNGAESNHNVLLTDNPTELVTGVTKTAESGKTIYYQFSTPKSFQWVTPLPQIITLTITD